MSDPIVSAWLRLGRTLFETARRDPEVRAHLVEVAREVIAWDETRRLHADTEAAVESASALDEVSARANPASECPAQAALPEIAAEAIGARLVTARALPATLVYSNVPAEAAHLDSVVAEAAPLPALDAVHETLLLKAEASRLALQQFRAGEVVRATEAIWERARAYPGIGFPWMLETVRPQTGDEEKWEVLATGFEVAALSVRRLRQLGADSHGADAVEQAVAEQAAKSQCLLRTAVEAVGQGFDQSQVALFSWLRTFAQRRRFFLRHMHITDTVDPAEASALHEAIASAIEAHERAQLHDRDLQGKLKKAAYHAGKIAKHPNGDTLHDWQTLAGALHDVVSKGMPPSALPLRELLLPILEYLPDLEGEWPNFDLVLREVDRYRASLPTYFAPALPEEETEAVVEARRLLRGRTLVLIGGESRREAKASLEKQLGLQEVIWLRSREHMPIGGFRPHILRPEVAVVVLAIRWSSHSFAEVKRFCDESKKPLVRLPGGYHPNQVARCIVEQASDRLAPWCSVA